MEVHAYIVRLLSDEKLYTGMRQRIADALGDLV